MLRAIHICSYMDETYRCIFLQSERYHGTHSLRAIACCAMRDDELIRDLPFSAEATSLTAGRSSGAEGVGRKVVWTSAAALYEATTTSSKYWNDSLMFSLSRHIPVAKMFRRSLIQPPKHHLLQPKLTRPFASKPHPHPSTEPLAQKLNIDDPSSGSLRDATQTAQSEAEDITPTTEESGTKAQPTQEPVAQAKDQDEPPAGSVRERAMEGMRGSENVSEGGR